MTFPTTFPWTPTNRRIEKMDITKNAMAQDVINRSTFLYTTNVVDIIAIEALYPVNTPIIDNTWPNFIAFSETSV
jgi:hypothetical protein